ncbi:hypothetical protein SNE40_023257 [Patella caerulea]|uniref:Tubulin polyglutamylase complex subunit 1-like C-terminal domain-containing protein n=1 Tax=Patella caerulea TaxID=87958 RepID=A0AAN8GHU7_PATCE
MAEKRKVVGDEKLQETDKQFLEKSNVKDMIKEALGKVIANRPEDPMKFFAEYFESYEEQCGLAQKSLQIIQMTHHSRPIFDLNVHQAFKILSKHKVSKKARGVNGAIYTDLLHALCREIQPAITSQLMCKVECCHYEAVPYDVFRSSVYTCCVLQDYSKLAEKLFKTLDVNNTGKAEKVICDVVLDQLKSVLSSSSTTNSIKIIDAGKKLGPEALYQAFEKVSNRGRGKGQTFQTSEQFVAEACEAFLMKVKKLR